MAGIMSFAETMSGFFSPSSEDPTRGHRIGRSRNLAWQSNLLIRVDDMDRFIDEPDHEAAIEGRFTAATLGEDMEVRDGRFNLFRREEGGMRQMLYRYSFSAGGAPFQLHGRKEIEHGLFEFDAIEDMTTLFTQILRGGPNGRVYGAGILRFHLRDLPHLLSSIQTPQHEGLERVKIVSKFFRFAYGELADTYLFNFR